MADMIATIMRLPIPARCRSTGIMTAVSTEPDEPVARLSASARTTLVKWLAMVATSDFRELPSIISQEAVYHSPVEWHPYPGHDLVCLLVRTAAGVFEGFKYLRVFIGGDDGNAVGAKTGPQIKAMRTQDQTLPRIGKQVLPELRPLVVVGSHATTSTSNRSTRTD